MSSVGDVYRGGGGRSNEMSESRPSCSSNSPLMSIITTKSNSTQGIDRKEKHMQLS